MKSQTLFTIPVGIVACVASFYFGRSVSDNERSAQQDSAPTASAAYSSRDGSVSITRSTDRNATSNRRPGTPDSSRGTTPAFGAILTASNPISRMEELLKYTQSLTAEEFPEALEKFQKAGFLTKNSTEYEILLTSWAKVDPQGALAGITEYPDSKNASLTVVTTWASLDPGAAEKWARENFDSSADPTKGNPHLVGVITGLVEQDLGTATRLLQEMPESGAQKDAIKSVLAKLQASDPDAAKAWTLSLAPGEAQDKAIAELAEEISSKNPAEAIEWATASGRETLLVATDGILDSWVENDPEAARAWAESQPKDVLAVAAPHLIKEMAKRDDYLEASEWLATHDGNPEFDESIEKLVKGARKEAPELAADWAARITDSQSREKVLTKLVEKWVKDDPARAREYLQQENVPESVRQQFESRSAAE
ncbi:hypothetical protein V2O64_19860 [Verrucomicrobiaceae bacterium 227]